MAEPAAQGSDGSRSALVAALAVLAAVSLLVESYGLTQLYLGMDLRALYVNGRLWNEGIVPYERAPDPGEPGPVNYPPLAIALFGAMAHLPFPALRLLWWAAQWIALAISLVLLQRLAPRALRGGAPWIAAALSAPVAVSFERGQIDPFLLFLLTAAAWLKATRGADAAPGLLVALAASLKVYPAVLVGYMALRAPRMLAWFAAGVLALAALAAAATGPRLFAEFAGGLPFLAAAERRPIPAGFAEIADAPRLMAGAGFPTSHHSLVVVADGRPYLYGTHLMAESQTAAWPLWWVLDRVAGEAASRLAVPLTAALLLALAAAATLRGRARANRPPPGQTTIVDEWSLWVMAAVLAVPRAWPFTYVTSLLPLAAAFGGVALVPARQRAAVLLVAGVALVLIHAPPPPIVPLSGWDRWPGALAGGVLLFALLAWRVGRSGAAGAAAGAAPPPIGAQP